MRFFLQIAVAMARKLNCAGASFESGLEPSCKIF